MILDEAIKHCEEKAKELRQKAECLTQSDGFCYEPDCLECAREHEQLAEWLKELKEAREELAEWDKLKLICANEGIVVYKVKE